MPDTCYCRESLVGGKCRVHGDDWVWRPCAFASVQAPRHTRRGPLRYCHLSAQFNASHLPDEMYATDCAACLIPELVGPLERFCDPEDWLGASEPGPWTCLWCDQPSADGSGHDIEHKADCPVYKGLRVLAKIKALGQEAEVATRE